jgi:hypothetical protein
MIGQTIHAVWDETAVVVVDANGEVLIERGCRPRTRATDKSRSPHINRRPVKWR